MTQPYDPRADWAREDREKAARIDYVHPARPRPAHLITAPIAAEILTERLFRQVAEYRAVERGFAETSAERLARQVAEATPDSDGVVRLRRGEAYTLR